jgi:hypothetical protein
MENKAQEKEIDQQKKEIKEKKTEPKISIKGGASVDLMSKLSEEESKVVEQKHSIDLRSVIFVLFVAIIGLVFVFYTNNIKRTFEREESRLADLESQLEAEVSLIRTNNKVVNRYDLYNYVQENFFSSKEVLVFWQEVSEDLCEISGIELSRQRGELEYEIRGVSENLINVAKFWHFISIDSRVSEVHLENMLLPDADAESSEVRFTFHGKLNIEYFDQ